MRTLPEIEINEKKREVAKLDLRDKKILYLLSQNARTPLSKIAKVVRLSRDSVKYRISNYEKKGIMKNSRALVDVNKLGYDSYHIFLRLNNPTKEAEQKFIRRVIALTYVRALLKFYGKYDFEIAVIAKSLSDFDEILTEIIGKTELNLQEHEILIITKNFRAGAFPNNFLKDSENLQNIKKTKPKKEYKLDKKDFEILKTIRDDAQLSLLDIGQAVKLSPDTVSYRLKKLEENTIISYTPVINHQAIGYTVHAILLSITNLDKQQEKKLEKFLQTNDNILWGVKTIGRYNILIYTCTHNDQEMQKTVSELRALFPENIRNYDSLLATDEFKYTYAPDCLFQGTK